MGCLKPFAVRCKVNDSNCAKPIPMFPRLPNLCQVQSQEGQWSAVVKSINADDRAPLPIEPPSWAVKAPGESRLEPISASVDLQCPVDLSTKKSFKVGRAPNMDIQLFHATSSRRHAILFHHSNGSCYVVDCGSAHGTFVDGKRVPPPTTDGVIVPQKVRRGAIIQFGGPGAPSFVLKSFCFRLADISDVPADTKDMGVLVRRNTRLNALGRSACESVLRGVENVSISLTVQQRKRSFDSLGTTETVDEEDDFDPHHNKRMRCSSPPLSPEEPIRLVSPDLPSVRASKTRRVRFAVAESSPPCKDSFTVVDDSSEEDN